MLHPFSFLSVSVLIHAGTPLGDPIEVGSASALFCSQASATRGAEGEAAGTLPFMWSTIKGYGGHQEAAAGKISSYMLIAPPFFCK
jgi:hypothetical protein